MSLFCKRYPGKQQSMPTYLHPSRSLGDETASPTQTIQTALTNGKLQRFESASFVPYELCMGDCHRAGITL